MKQQMSSRTSGGGAASDLDEQTTSTSGEASNQLAIEQMQEALGNAPAEESSSLLEDDGGSGTGGGTAGLRMGIPLVDVIYEQLAHRAAYLQFPASLQLDRPKDPKAFEQTRKDATGAAITKWADVEEIRKLIDKLGYTPEVVHDDPLTGFQAILFRPTINGVRIEQVIDNKEVRQNLGLKDGLRPVVAFRGSQSDRSWADDFNPEGVGTHQFAMNEAEIVKLLTLGGDDYGPADVTGHSLGGALAQLAAARYPSMVKRCVTFQAPGISEKDAKNSEKDATKSTHYRVKGDLVPVSGEAHTRGTGSEERCFEHEEVSGVSLRHPIDSSGQRVTDAHISYPLEDIHAGADNDKQPFIPALQEFHDAHDEDHRDPKVTEVKGTPRIFHEGRGESNRVGKMGALRLNVAEDWLNGPIVVLSEQLRDNLADAYRTAETGIDCEAHITEMVRFVHDGGVQVVDDALAAWIAKQQDDQTARLTWDPQYKGPDAPAPDDPKVLRSQLEAAWKTRRQRLIEETAALVRMQLGKDAWLKNEGKEALYRRDA